MFDWVGFIMGVEIHAHQLAFYLVCLKNLPCADYNIVTSKGHSITDFLYSAVSGHY